MAISSALGSSALLPAGLGFRNVLINGGFDVWQRGTSGFTITSSVYTSDRWKCQIPTSGSVTQETSDIPIGFRYAWKYASTGSNSFMQAGQQIEFSNCYQTQNKQIIISFYGKALNTNSGSTALTVRTRTIAGVDGTCIFSGTNSDSSITLTTSWVRYQVTRTLPLSFGSLSLEFALGSHVSGDGILITGVQLEQNLQPTPFEQRPIGVELALCQRYYYRTDTGNGNALFRSIGKGFAYSTTAIQGFVSFPTRLRIAPTAIEAYGSIRILDYINVFTIFVVSLDAARTTTDLGVFTCTTSGMTAFRPYDIESNNSLTSALAWSAEL